MPGAAQDAEDRAQGTSSCSVGLLLSWEAQARNPETNEKLRCILVLISERRDELGDGRKRGWRTPVGEDLETASPHG